MGIHVHEFMSLDGVIDAPVWTADFGFDPKMGDTLGALTGNATGILLGRTTFEMFEPAWSTRTVEDDPGAPFFNDTTKYVVSSTLKDPTWSNSQVVGPYDAGALRTLKDVVAGDIYVSGSATLVHALLADGLVDGLHLSCIRSRAGKDHGCSPMARRRATSRSPPARSTATASSTSTTRPRPSFWAELARWRHAGLPRRCMSTIWTPRASSHVDVRCQPPQTSQR